MKRASQCGVVIAVVLLALAGCGVDDQASTTSLNTPASQEFNGLRVTYADGGPHEPAAETIEQWFQDAIECADTIGPPGRAGLSVPPPLVIIVPMGTNDPSDGTTFFETATIKIERQSAHVIVLHIHEFIHWILYARGAPLPSNINHQEPESDCPFFFIG